MYIFDEQSEVVKIESLTEPIATTHFWALDLPSMDFMMLPLESLEQTTCPTLELTIDGFSFRVPAAWNILIYDVSTMQVDMIPLAEAAGREFTAFGYGPRVRYPVPLTVRATDYINEAVNIGPLFSKRQMMCHPVNSELWVCLSSSDGYNRFLKNLAVGALIGEH